jgi:preprotein translocase subunit SecG
MMRVLLPILIILVLVIIGAGVMQMSNNERAISDAQAAIESARAMQDAAQAARTAAEGQARATTALIVVSLLLVLVLLAALVLAGAAYLHAKLAPKKKWAPGPNAGWKQVGEGAPPAPSPAQSALLQLLLMERLAGPRRPDPPAPLQPPQEDDQGLPPWGW